jgi:molybdopterin molybdotransferase
LSAITAQQALEIITGIEACPDPPVTKPLIEAAGHVLAQEVTAPRDIPPFNRSAMDGYAVRSEDVKEIPARLKVVAVREAGDQEEITLGSGECVKIMTGAAVPDDADAVVMIESTRSDEPARYTEILKPVKPGQNIARRGEDAQAGSVVLRKGQVLTGPALSLAAGVGQGQLEVYPLPELAVLQTGGELLEPGDEATGNKIYNSNATLLAGMVHDTQIATSRYIGISPDQKERLTEAVRDGMLSKVLILTGGVSKGDFDYVPEVLVNCGVQVKIQGVRIKPGRPLIFGSTETGGFVFGLPGNPVSVMVCFHEFVVPLLRRLAGMSGTVTAADLPATLTAPVRNKSGRTFYCPAKLLSRNGQLFAEPLPGHGSGDYVSAAATNGVIIIPDDTTCLEAGTEVKVHLWQIPLRVGNAKC